MDQGRVLADRFTAEYLQKLFYFCLRRVGSPEEAEDLASDITVSVLSALQRGTEPHDFNAWVWQIARNRYCRWAIRRRQNADRTVDTDPEELQIADPSDPTEGLITAEQETTLRRELAFARREYRELLIAYYFEGKKLREIAETLGVPEGTIKYRLFDARAKLREGMEMAREFGKRSYQPEEIRFTGSGPLKNGQPWKSINRKLPNNVLLQAYENPSTAEELAMELGIALPYMEGEIRLLLEPSLLIRQGNRYVTNFCILSAEAQRQVETELNRERRLRCELTDRITSDMIAPCRDFGIISPVMSDNEARWILFHAVFERAAFFSWDRFTPQCGVKRCDGGRWGLIGYERGDKDPREHVISFSSRLDASEALLSFCYPEKIGIPSWSKEFPSAALLLLIRLVQGQTTVRQLNERERRLWESRIRNRMAVEDADEKTLLKIALFDADTNVAPFAQALQAHPLYGELLRKIADCFDVSAEIVRRSLRAPAADQADYCTSILLIALLRTMAFEDELEAGNIALPADPANSAVNSALVCGWPFFWRPEWPA